MNNLVISTKKRNLIIGISLSLIIMIIGTTYAYFTWQSSNNTLVDITVEDMADVVFKGGNDINITNIGPVLDYNDGEITEFYIKKKMDNNLDININITPTILPDSLKDESFKVKLLSSTDNITYTEIKEDNFKDKETNIKFTLSTTELTNNLTYFKVIFYIDGNMLNSNNMKGQSFGAKIDISVDKNEPNAPVLAEGMIPITYDGSNWVKADINNTDNNWYDYENKQWANAVMVVADNTYQTYLVDSSTNKFDAKLVNGAKVVTVNGEKAIELDGVDDYIEVPTLPSNIDFVSGYTVEVTMKWKELASFSRIMDFGNGSNADNLIIANWGTYSTPYLAYYNGSTKTSYPYSSITFSKNTKETYKFELIKGSEYYTLNMYLNETKKVTNNDKIKVGALKNINRGNNYIGKSNWDDPYLAAYVYDFKIIDANGKKILSYNANNTRTEKLNTKTRTEYMNADIGTIIPENDILAYYVWIPRYKYKLFNATYASGTSPSLIDVVFENETSTTGTVTCTYASNGAETCTNKSNGNWYTHPAFTMINASGNKTELKGIWVGKFETTGSETTPTVKPGISSLRSIRVSSMYSTGLLFRSTDYLTTNGVSTADSHMMKNIEWGAVAYLKQSIYGLGITDIGINSNNSYYTGGGSGTSYKTNIGQSTNGNITGVYDMSGGAVEYVMGNYNKTVGNSGLTVSGVPAEHIDIYSGTSVSASHLGDALGETAGWYSDFARFVSSSHPWFVRGGYYVDRDSAGVFYLGAGTGEDDGDSRGFRVALSTTGA